MVVDLENQIRILQDKAFPEVHVVEVAHAGVTIHLAGIETVLSTALKGPFTFAPRKSGGVTEIVLIDGTDQSKSVLPSYPIQPAEGATAVRGIEKTA